MVESKTDLLNANVKDLEGEIGFEVLKSSNWNRKFQPNTEEVEGNVMQTEKEGLVLVFEDRLYKYMTDQRVKSEVDSGLACYISTDAKSFATDNAKYGTLLQTLAHDRLQIEKSITHEVEIVKNLEILCQKFSVCPYQDSLKLKPAQRNEVVKLYRACVLDKSIVMENSGFVAKYQVIGVTNEDSLNTILKITPYREPTLVIGHDINHKCHVYVCDTNSKEKMYSFEI